MGIPAELQLAVDEAQQVREDDTKVTTRESSRDGDQPVEDNIANLFEPVESSDTEVEESLPDLPGTDLEPLTTESFLGSNDSLPEVKDSDKTPDQTENDDLKKAIAELTDRISRNDSEKEQDEALQKELDKIASKYGDADPEMMDQFSDLFKSFRSKMGSEIQSEMTRSEFKLTKQLEDLKAQIKSMQEVKPITPEPKPAEQVTHDNYRNIMAEMIPNYSKIIGSDTFKRLMALPVDKDNPDFKYDNKLGAMFKSRRTDDIVKLFSDVEKKYFSTQENSPVIDSGASKPSGGDTSTKAKLTPERLQGVLQQVMEGDRTMSEQELSSLLKLAAKTKT